MHDMTTRIAGARALIDGDLAEAEIVIDGASGCIAGPNGRHGAECDLDARGLLLLPGIVDVHGDAFERQLMPRPGVDFALDIALLESDRQALANGITTVFHGVTWSWEPGLRNADNAHAIRDAVARLRPQLGADTRFHLRHETFNLDAEAEIAGWLERREIDLIAFNDHMILADPATTKPSKLATMVERSGVSRDAFLARVAEVRARADEVPHSIARLAKVATEHGVPLLSHDDTSPEERRRFRALGCRVAEFPTTVETAREAADAGDDIVLGAPNVVRGGSHTGWINAADMVAQGLCSVLASDYYYPAPLIAAFRLAADGVVPLAQAWALVAQNPASAVGLSDRGTIAAGRRGDLILVDAQEPRRPRVVATFVAGRIVYLADARRLRAA